MKCAVVFVLAMTATVAAAQSFRIAAIQATGLKRATVDDVVKASGLAVGQSVSQADIDKAAGKLVASGLFDRANYRVTMAAGQITIIFDVNEISSVVPVVYDNFIWFSDDEVAKAIRVEVPAYDGTAADGPMVDSVGRALTNLLRTRGIPGAVTHLPFVNLDGTGRRHIFKISNPAPKVCAVRFPGASAALDVELRKVAQDLLKNDYSRQFLDQFVERTATQPYRHLGYWKATFGAPVATPAPAGCDGAAVSLPVTEGDSYRWHGAQFSGNSTIASTTLEALLGHRSGDVADGAKIELGRIAIRKAYGKFGYLAVTTNFATQLDEAGKRAMFVFSVNEGPLFLMGKLMVIGLSAKDAAALAKKWTLKAGDAFDMTYSDGFRGQRDVVMLVGAGRIMSVELVVAPGTHIVDVTLSIKR